MKKLIYLIAILFAFIVLNSCTFLSSTKIIKDRVYTVKSITHYTQDNHWAYEYELYCISSSLDNIKYLTDSKLNVNVGDTLYFEPKKLVLIGDTSYFKPVLNISENITTLKY